MAWHPHHESVLLSGGYNGSLIYWLAKYNQVSLLASLADHGGTEILRLD
jgi:hypothetical protein